MTQKAAEVINRLKAVRPGIDTLNEHIIFMRYDCPVCRSEGFESLTRIIIRNGQHSIIATLNVVTSEIISHEVAALSDSAWIALQLNEGDFIELSHLPPIGSLGLVRAKIYGMELSYDNYISIMKDVVSGNYSSIHLTGFVTACASRTMHEREIVSLTRSMIDIGERINWDRPMVLDKHCIGGIPANRTTPIVVSIIAALGYTIPKTSSRAITSPAGTADVMETLTNVNLDIERMKEVVAKENACLAWGGSVMLSPADDILIRIEKSLDIDTEAQMIASVLSKKAAAGATHVLIDIPLGPTAKVRKPKDAQRLQHLFEHIGRQIGLVVRALITDGSQPIGNGIGPVLEALDILAVFRNEPAAPLDLKEKSLLLAAELLELAGHSPGKGVLEARRCLDSGLAYQKFQAICLAQGNVKEPSLAPYSRDVISTKTGQVAGIDSRKIAKVAKLSGGPNDLAGGVYLKVHLQTAVIKGQPLYTVFADSPGQLQYALDYINQEVDIITIE